MSEAQDTTEAADGQSRLTAVLGKAINRLNLGICKVWLILRRVFSTPSHIEQEPWRHLRQQIQEQRLAETQQLKETIVVLIQAELAATKAPIRQSPQESNESIQRQAT